MHRLFALFGAMGLMVFSAGLQAECLRVVESGVSPDEREVASSVSWYAVIENECRMPYDADLTVVFVDGDGNSLYEIQDLVTVGRAATEKTGKSVYIPSEYIAQLAGVHIDIEERERPF